MRTSSFFTLILTKRFCENLEYFSSIDYDLQIGTGGLIQCLFICDRIYQV